MPPKQPLADICCVVGLPQTKRTHSKTRPEQHAARVERVHVVPRPYAAERMAQHEDARGREHRAIIGFCRGSDRLVDQARQLAQRRARRRVCRAARDSLPLWAHWPSL